MVESQRKALLIFGLMGPANVETHLTIYIGVRTARPNRPWPLPRKVSKYRIDRPTAPPEISKMCPPRGNFKEIFRKFSGASGASPPEPPFVHNFY